MHVKPLDDLARRWIAVKNTSRPSPDTALAREYDLWSIGKHLAVDTESRTGNDKLAVLAPLVADDLVLQRLEDAFAAYSSTHAASSTRRVMSSWRQFCLWLVRDGHLQSNPMDHIETPARSPWAPKPLQQEDLAAVAEHASVPAPSTRSAWAERDEALFALLIAAGLRVSEVINLEVGDCYLNDDPARLRITGKGDKTRTVPIPPEVVKRANTYLESRKDREIGIDPTTPLLLRPDGRPMTRSAVDYAVRGWFQRAGRKPPKGALAHSFRHTYATMLIDNGASLPEVQQLLGHSDLSTTQAYLGVTAKGLEETALSNPARKLLE